MRQSLMTGAGFFVGKGEGIKLLDLQNTGQKILQLDESYNKGDDSVEK